MREEKFMRYTSSHIDGQQLDRLDDLIWIGDIPSIGVQRCPERDAVVFPDMGMRCTYSQLESSCNAFVAAMSELGLREGDRVAYLGRNSDLYLPVLFGAIRAGLTLVPLNWRLTVPELSYQLMDSNTRLLVSDRDFASAALEACRDINPAPTILWTESGEDGTGLRERLSQIPASSFPLRRNPHQTILQLYTSGTTGRPKGVLISHRALSLSRHAERINPDFDHLGTGVVTLSAMPNFHIGGMSWVLMGLVRFGTVVLTADPGPANMLRLIREYRTEHSFIVPTVIRGIVNALIESGEPPPPIKGIFYGAMPMSESLLRESMNLFRDCAFVQFFGMTEIAGSATYLPPQGHDLARPELLKSVGKPYSGMSLEIRGPDRTSVLRPGEHGEIWIKSPTLMQGYWNQDEKTRQVIDGDWYASGDGGRINEDGYLFLTDRIKDMIVSGGENVYPAEVEEALRQHPSVLDVAVVAMPDPRWGEAVAAVVELRPGAELSEEDLRTFVRGRIAGYKCPKAIHFTEALPRTSSGKLKRAELRSQFSPKTNATES
ncbi:MAG: AMP-binding protein [Pseudomonadota bacterium]|nr:AMP-binding protein [Pseudomonadota bacterium]